MSDPKLNADLIRQGDVLLVRIADPSAYDAAYGPAMESASDIVAHGYDNAARDARIVLREGESTGHAHAFYEPAKVRLDVPKRHLRVVETALLKHEEHTHIDVPPGTYDLPTQVEWTDENEPRPVQD